VAFLDLVEQMEQPRPALGCVVEANVELGDPPQAQARPELAPHERHRPVQGLDRRVPLFGLADHADPQLGVPQVGSGFNVGHGHEADPRIGYFAGENLPDLLAKELIDAISSLRHRYPIKRS
jgi:hypothetical protein